MFGTVENLLFLRLPNNGGAGNKEGVFRVNEGLGKALISSFLFTICVFGSLTTRNGTGAENPDFWSNLVRPLSLFVAFGCILVREVEKRLIGELTTRMLEEIDVDVKSSLGGVWTSPEISMDIF